jgi:hypothetical protein
MMNLNPFSALSSILTNPASLLQLAAGPAGWASLAMQTLMSTVGKEIISQIGKQLGLPESIVSLAQNAFTAASGNSGASSLGQGISGLSDAFGFKGALAGQFQREAKNQIQDFVQQQVNQATEKGGKRLVDTLMENEDTKSAKYAGKANKKGGGANGANGASPSNTTGSNSLLMTIALALGQAADKKLVRMGEIAKQIGATEDGKNQNKITEMGAELQALGQEMSILSSALTNALRSIGEANSQIARKS